MTTGIESERATVQTGTVTLQRVEVDGNKMTMATFRQIRERELVPVEQPPLDELGLSGEVWGTVNYYFGDCSDKGPDDHLHVLGADEDGKLFRSCFDPNDPMPAWCRKIRWICDFYDDPGTMESKLHKCLDPSDDFTYTLPRPARRTAKRLFGDQLDVFGADRSLAVLNLYRWARHDPGHVRTAARMAQERVLDSPHIFIAT